MIKLERFIITPFYIIGRCEIPHNGKNTTIYTLELPYKQNKKDISCIPTGIYNISEFFSPNFGSCLKIDNDGQDSCVELKKIFDFSKINSNLILNEKEINII